MPRNDIAGHRSDIEPTRGANSGRLIRPSGNYTATMRAWERFVSGEPITAEKVEAAVVASWQRSVKCGISPRRREAPLVSGDEFERLRWGHRELLRAASSILTATKELLAGSKSMMLLTGSDGIVLDAVGDTQILDQGQNIHLALGGDWRESAIGTNGIGTAIATGRPTQIHAAEHFCAA